MSSMNHGVQGPKAIFRCLESWCRNVFSENPGPGVFECIGEGLPSGPGRLLGIQSAQVEVLKPGFPEASASNPSYLRIEAFRRIFQLTLCFTPEVESERAELIVSALSSVLSMCVIEDSFGSTMREAAEIQCSLLREAPPDLAGFDIAVRCKPADEVGGDLYDFLELDAQTLGLAVGDASGHGLPAALLARDIVIGLRMGMEKDLRPAHTLERLNQVIHTSSLSSCFVSLLYAELETNGNLFYFNAGHEPPILFGDGGLRHLSRSDTVIGPLEEARFKRHFAHVDRGSTLVIYTDGLLERRSDTGDLFGLDRLVQATESALGKSAQEIVDHVFGEVDAFGSSPAWEDDATLLVVKRLG
ncbi:MAG: serine phosphatase RsbU (regulator of sigma subunit) [Planctomycetota bacterium]|jgi:serine phosphatase RsbU (regulator of sigma subunit)